MARVAGAVQLLMILLASHDSRISLLELKCFTLDYRPHPVAVYNRGSVKGLHIHVIIIFTKLLLSGGSIQALLVVL